MKHLRFALLFRLCLVLSAPVLYGQIDGHVPYDFRADVKDLSDLAILRLEQGALNEAESLCRQAISLLQQSGGRGSADYAVAEGNLASVLIARARYIEADRLLDEALDLARRCVGVTDPRIATLLADRAELRLQQGRFREAIGTMQQVVTIRELRPSEAQHLAESYQNLGVAYLAEGKYTRAIRYLSRAERLWNTSMPADDPARLAGWNAQLIVYERTHQDQQADRIIALILSQAGKCLQRQPIELALLFNNIGTIYRERGRNRQAAEFFDRAYQIDLDLLGEFHPQTALAHMNYGLTIQNLGRVDEGRNIATRAKAALSLVR